MDDQRVTAEQEPKEIAVADMTRGLWIQVIDEDGDDHGEAEVLHVEMYPDSFGGNSAMLIFRSHVGSDPQMLRIDPNMTMPPIPVERLAEAKATAERAQRIADIRALTDWLEANPFVPMPYKVDAGEHLDARHPGGSSEADSYATVRALAARLGVELEERLDDRTALRVPFGHAEYSLIAWHPNGRPAEPQPLVDPDASMEAHYDAEADNPVPHPSWPTEAELKPWESLSPQADRIAESMEPAPIAKHYETSGWKGEGPGTCGIECACGVTYDGFDSLAEAKQQLAWHIADPTDGPCVDPDCPNASWPHRASSDLADQSGLTYSRPADGDDPQPVAGRMPPHTGGMTAEGLVDETASEPGYAAEPVPGRVESHPDWAKHEHGCGGGRQCRCDLADEPF